MAQAPKKPQPVRHIHLSRSILVKGEHCEAGDVLDVDVDEKEEQDFARYMIGIGKAVEVTSEEAKQIRRENKAKADAAAKTADASTDQK